MKRESSGQNATDRVIGARRALLPRVRHRLPIALVVAIIAGVTYFAASGPAVRSVGAGNAITKENAKAGSPAWNKLFDRDALKRATQPPAINDDAPTTKSTADSGAFPSVDVANVSPFATTHYNQKNPTVGYTGSDSYNIGSSIDIHVSTSVNYTLELYRVGWYNGAGARLVYSSTNRTGSVQSTPAPDGLGTVNCTWPTSLSIPTDTTWTSGVYIVVLTPNSGGGPSYIPVVMRDDSRQRSGAALYQLPTNTFQAYNNWGGRSTYDAFSSPSRAFRVSFNRPYNWYDGSQFLFWGHVQAIQWLERQGYDVTYIASSDTDRDVTVMNGRSALLVMDHDEYWTMNMRNNLDSWVAQGHSALFFTANSIYWQVRLDASPDGNPRRYMTVYKSDADPIVATQPKLTTNLWRSTNVAMPEYKFFGSQYVADYIVAWDSQPWIVTNASNWVYAGTGLTNGASIGGLIGGEWDVVPNVNDLPAGLVVLSNSPVVGQPGVSSGPQGATIHQVGSAWIFDAATNYWARRLGGDTLWAADSRVQQITTNLLAAAGLTPSGTPPTSTSSTTSSTTTSTTTSSTTTSTTTLPLYIPIRLNAPGLVVTAAPAPRSDSPLVTSSGTGSNGRSAAPGATGG